MFKVSRGHTEYDVTLAFIPERDPVREAPTLRIQVVDRNGHCFEFTLSANSVTSQDDRDAVEFFAYAVEEEGRKRTYRERGDNYEKVRLEIAEDRDAHFFRQRRGRDRYEGLGDAALQAWHSHR